MVVAVVVVVVVVVVVIVVILFPEKYNRIMCLWVQQGGYGSLV